MATSSDLFETTPEKTNFARLCRLLIDGGTRALRKVLDGIHPLSTLTNVLTQYNNKMSLSKLKPKVINQKEWNMLYPMPGIPVNSMNFDITLLTILLRNICNLQKPKTGWDNLPPTSDRSKEADIARIKYYRNKLCHGKTTSVTEFHFHGYWNDTADALERLGVNRDDIDKLETVSMDSELEQRYIDDLREWKCKEEESEDLIQTILKVMDIREGDKIYCDKHRNDHLNMYCKECTEPICTSCAQVQHEGHKKGDIGIEAKFWCEKVARESEAVERKLTETKNSIQSAQTVSQRLTQDFESKNEQIQCLATTEDKKRELTDKLQHHYDKIITDVGSDMKVLESNVKRLKNSQSYLRHVSSIDNNTKLLTECKVINNHLDEIGNLETKFLHSYIDCLAVEVTETNGKFDLSFLAIPALSSVIQIDKSSHFLRKYDELRYEICTKNYYGDCVYDSEGLEATVKDSKGKKKKLELKPLETEERAEHQGTHRVTFQFLEPGIHELSVKVRGKDIDGSPCTTENVAPTFNVRTIGYKSENIEGRDITSYSPLITTSTHGKVIVVTHADTSKSGLHIFNRDLEKEKSVELSLRCKRCRPREIAVSTQNTCLMTGCDSHPVCEYDFEGNFIKVIGEGKMTVAHSLAVNTKTKMLYATGKCTVYMFECHDGVYNYKKCVPVKSATELARGPQFLVTIDSQDRLILVQTGSKFLREIVMFVLSAEGKYLLEYTMGECVSRTIWFIKYGIGYPQYVTIDKDNNIYVSCITSHKVMKFTESGEFLYSVLCSEGTAADRVLFYPTGVAVIDKVPQIILVPDKDHIKIYEEA